MENTVVVPIKTGIHAPVHSLTDSTVLPEGSLVRATNCTFLPSGHLSLWRPGLTSKLLLTVTDSETVQHACFACNYIAFITWDGTTYRCYLYSFDSLVAGTASPTVVFSFTKEESVLATCTISSSFAAFCIEGEPPVFVSLEDNTVALGGSAFLAEAGVGDAQEFAVVGGTQVLLTELTVKDACAFFVSSFCGWFAKSDPDLYGEAQLVVLVDGVEKARSVELLYLGSLPDMSAVGEGGFSPVSFTLDSDVFVVAGNVISFRLEFGRVDLSESGTNKLLLQSGSGDKEFLAERTGIAAHCFVNGAFAPRGGLCYSGQGRTFVATEDGMIYSGSVDIPWVFDGYAQTGITLTGLFVQKTEVVAFSKNKCCSLTGIWPDQLESADILPFGVQHQQGVLQIGDTVFLGWGGTLAAYKRAPLANPFLSDPTEVSFINYYKRLNLIVQTLVGYGRHIVYQLNGLHTTVWELEDEGEIVVIAGDYCLLRDGQWSLLDWSNVGFEVEVMTKAIDCGVECIFDRVKVLSGLTGSGSVGLLLCSDALEADNWEVGTTQTPFSQWHSIVLPFEEVKLQLPNSSLPEWGSGLYFGTDDVAQFYNNPVNCFALSTTDSETMPSGWAVSCWIKLSSEAVKTPGVLLGGFVLSVVDKTPRKGAAL